MSKEILKGNVYYLAEIIQVKILIEAIQGKISVLFQDVLS